MGGVSKCKEGIAKTFKGIPIFRIMTFIKILGYVLGIKSFPNQLIFELLNRFE
jgi:hypothetical protein